MNIDGNRTRHTSDASLERKDPGVAQQPNEANPSHPQQHALLNDLSSRAAMPGARTHTAFRSQTPPLPATGAPRPPAPPPAISSAPPPPPPPMAPGNAHANAAGAPGAQQSANVDVSHHARAGIDLASRQAIDDTTSPFHRSFAVNGRHYVPLGPAGHAHEVTHAGTRVHLHTDGAPLGPRLRNRHGNWEVDPEFSATPRPNYTSRQNEAGNLRPMENAPVFYSNVDNAPLQNLDVGTHVDEERIKAAIQSRYGQHGANLNGVELVQSSCQDIADKSGVQYDSTNHKANPPAWTSPEGKIHIAADHPDYATGGRPDVDKIRSTVVHEFIHAASAGHTGLQDRTRLAREGKDSINYDEAIVDHLGHEVYRDLYPGKPYKSAYFNESRTFWQGNLPKFMEDRGIMSKHEIRDAMFKDPAQLKQLEGDAYTEWKRWDNH